MILLNVMKKLTSDNALFTQSLFEASSQVWIEMWERLHFHLQYQCLMSLNVIFRIFLHLECIQRLSNINRGCGSQRSTDKVNWNIIFWAGCVIYHKIILNQQKLCLSSNINRIKGCRSDHFQPMKIRMRSNWPITGQKTDQNVHPLYISVSHHVSFLVLVQSGASATLKKVYIYICWGWDSVLGELPF